MRRHTALGIATFVVLAVMAAPVRAADEEPVLTTAAFEYAPAANDVLLAWSGYGRGDYIAYVKPIAGGSRTRLSRPGINGYVGSVDGTVVTFQEWSTNRDVSDIFEYDTATEDRAKLGPPVSTSAWEYHPSRSGDLVAFTRLMPSGIRKVLLYDAGTDAARVIDETRDIGRSISVGQLSGNWLVYEKTSFNDRRTLGCNIFLYDIDSDTATKIPNPNDRCQYAPSVDDAGTVFYARSGIGCGNDVELRALPLGSDTPTTLVEYRDVHDLAKTYAHENGDGTTDLYYERQGCRNFVSDILKVSWEPT